MKKALFFPLQVSLCTVGCLQIFNNIAQAQVTPDGTVNTVVTPNENVSEITGGEARGSNLFHSFQNFSVPTGNEAFFNNADSISNIFSRVTGGNISNIDGAIRANGSANLFLINPAGIIFGENARLDIGGSFLGSTASSFLFEDGEFSAADLENPPILTVNAPIGLGFRDNPQPITNLSIADDIGLQVDTGKNIILVGGDVFLDGGSIFAPGGRVELGGLAEEGTIDFNDNSSLNFSENFTKSNISLTNEAVINVRADSGGFVAINSRNLEILEGSKIRAGIAPELGSPQSIAGNIDVISTETVNISGASTFISNAVVVGAVGRAGDVNITTESLSLRDGGQANSLTQGQGDAGNVNVTANNISIDGIASNGDRSGFYDTVAPDAVGNGGEINIEAVTLSVTNGAIINASTFGQGNAGNIFIQASNSISVDNSLILSIIQNGAIGDGGDINIQAKSLSLIDGSQVTSAVFRQEDNSPISGGQGNGGNIEITTTDFVNISGVDANSFSSGLLTITEQGANGQAGDITVNTNVFRLSSSGNINSATRNSSNAGNITINANIFEAISGGQIRATTRSNGNAGNITLNIDDKVIISGSDPTFEQRLAEFGENFVSDAGANSGLFVNATSNSTGQAGSLILNSGQLSLSQRGVVLASTQSGEGGNVSLNVEDNLTLRENSLISAQAFGDADGGNIAIDANFIIAFPNETPGNGSDIIASAVDGDGGNINITAESLLGIQEEAALERNGSNDIDASSDFGLDGTISIFTPNINPIQGVTELPQNTVEPEETIAQACQSNREAAARNNFVISGKGGIPTPPESPLDSHNLVVGNENNSTSIPSQPIKTSQSHIQPARGIEVTESGEIILTAYKTDGLNNRLPEIKRNCNA